MTVMVAWFVWVIGRYKCRWGWGWWWLWWLIQSRIGTGAEEVAELLKPMSSNPDQFVSVGLSQRSLVAFRSEMCNAVVESTQDIHLSRLVTTTEEEWNDCVNQAGTWVSTLVWLPWVRRRRRWQHKLPFSLRISHGQRANQILDLLLPAADVNYFESIPWLLLNEWINTWGREVELERLKADLILCNHSHRLTKTHPKHSGFEQCFGPGPSSDGLGNRAVRVRSGSATALVSCWQHTLTVAHALDDDRPCLWLRRSRNKTCKI